MSDKKHDHPTPATYPSDCEVLQGLRKRAVDRQQEATARGYTWRSCFGKAKKIKLLLLDVDGVLTDGTITYTHEGTEIKTFHTRDGMGIRLLREAGIETGIITARSSKNSAVNLPLDLPKWPTWVMTGWIWPCWPGSAFRRRLPMERWKSVNSLIM
jgi:hypothetical protein